MSKVKNRITAYIKENLKHEDQFDNIKNKLDLHMISKKENNYFLNKTKILKIILPCILLFMCVVTGIVIVSLNTSSVNSKPVAIIQMDVNPSISFVVDEENKVVSVHGENDEGKMIINDEVIVGLKLELAIEKILTIENETGYLISGNIETDNNVISFNIESDKETVIDDLENKIKSYVSSACEKLDIKENIQIIKSKTKEQLVKRAIELDPTLTIDQANSKTAEQLILYISGCQLEKINIPTEELEQLYNSFKQQRINIIEKEETKKFIETLDNTYQVIINNYDLLYNSLINAQQKLNEVYLQQFIDETSLYQQCVKKCQEMKLEVLKLENEICKMEESYNKTILEQVLKTKKLSLDVQLQTLSLTKTTAYGILKIANDSIDYILSEMEEFKANLPEEVKNNMEKSLIDSENKINEMKEKAVVEFENKYKEQLVNAYNNVKNYKAKLVEQLKNKAM